MNNGKIPQYQLRNEIRNKYKFIANEGSLENLTGSINNMISLLYYEEHNLVDYRGDYLIDIENFIENEIEPLKKEAIRRFDYLHRVWLLSMYKVSLLPDDIKRHISEFIPKEIEYTKKVTTINYYRNIIDTSYFKNIPLDKLYKIVKDNDFIIVFKSYSKKKIINDILDNLILIDIKYLQGFYFNNKPFTLLYDLLLTINTYKKIADKKKL
jgi:hypothetical protein